MNDCVCRIQNRLRRAVVLFKFDHLGRRIILLEINDIPEIGAAPGINTLVSITDCTDILILSCNKFCHQVLCMVRILIFIDQNIVESVLPASPD